MWGRGDAFNPYVELNLDASDNFDRNLKAWWMVTPATSGGGKWYDLRQRYPATLTSFTGGSWKGSSQRFGCLQFDGSAAYVDVPSGVRQASTSGSTFTYACWFNTTSAGTNLFLVGEGNTSENNSIFGIRSDTTSATHVATILRDPSGVSATVTGTSTINDGAWHHVAVTGDGSTLTLYVDGKSEGTPAGLGSVGVLTTPDKVSIGALSRAAVSQFFPGQLDDVRCYFSCLAARDVNQLYRDSREGYPLGLNRRLAYPAHLFAAAAGAATVNGRRTTYSRAGSRGVM